MRRPPLPILVRKILPLLLFAGIGIGPAYSQLVNIESKRMQTDTIRFALKGDAQMNYSRQNEDRFFTVNSNLTVQLKSRDLKKTWFLLGNYSLAQSEDEDFQNSWTLHLRYNQRLAEGLWAEAYIQHQNNQLLVIDNRFLVGTGVRFRVISRETLTAFLGNAIMFEIDRSHEFDQRNTNLRHSAYFTLNYSPKGDWISLVNTLYFQPLYQSISDHRLMEQFKAEVPLTSVFSFSGSFNYALFSTTPSGERDLSSSVLFGVTVTL